MSYSRRVVDNYFSLFESLLVNVALPTSDGLGRIADVSEFMFMGIYCDKLNFKHIDQRRYVFVDQTTHKLSWNNGSIFDTFNPVAAKVCFDRWTKEQVKE